jgi:hypothetical protein
MPDLYEPCMCMCMFLAPITFLAYQIFGIVYLVESYMDISNPCIGHIWPYILVSLLSSWPNINVTKNQHSAVDNGPAIICLVLLNTGLAVWGGIELANPLCKVMMDTHLWKFGFATFILQSFSGLLILIVACCGIISLSVTNRDRATYNEV